MLGHQQVLKARRKGYKPAAVFVEIGTPPAGAASPERDLLDGLLPAVWTMGALPAAADLRFLFRSRVHVTLLQGSSEMFWAWWDAIRAAKPAEMYGVEPDGEVLTWRA
jgi:hypothetical protein